MPSRFRLVCLHFVVFFFAHRKLMGLGSALSTLLIHRHLFTGLFCVCSQSYGEEKKNFTGNFNPWNLSHKFMPVHIHKHNISVLLYDLTLQKLCVAFKWSGFTMSHLQNAPHKHVVRAGWLAQVNLNVNFVVFCHLHALRQKRTIKCEHRESVHRTPNRYRTCAKINQKNRWIYMSWMESAQNEGNCSPVDICLRNNQRKIETQRWGRKKFGHGSTVTLISLLVFA